MYYNLKALKKQFKPHWKQFFFLIYILSLRSVITLYAQEAPYGVNFVLVLVQFLSKTSYCSKSKKYLRNIWCSFWDTWENCLWTYLHRTETSIDHTLHYRQVWGKQEDMDDSMLCDLCMTRSSVCKLLNRFLKRNSHLVYQSTVN